MEVASTETRGHLLGHGRLAAVQTVDWSGVEVLEVRGGRRDVLVVDGVSKRGPFEPWRGDEVSRDPRQRIHLGR